MPEGIFLSLAARPRTPAFLRICQLMEAKLVGADTASLFGGDGLSLVVVSNVHSTCPGCACEENAFGATTRVDSLHFHQDYVSAAKGRVVKAKIVEHCGQSLSHVDFARSLALCSAPREVT